MTEEEKDIPETPEGKKADEGSACLQEGEDYPESQKPLTSGDIRNGSYFVLVIAAVFVINAMETGSYRTPWPVAILVSMVGLGLLAYSFVKEKHEKDNS